MSDSNGFPVGSVQILVVVVGDSRLGRISSIYPWLSLSLSLSITRFSHGTMVRMVSYIARRLRDNYQKISAGTPDSPLNPFRGFLSPSAFRRKSIGIRENSGLVRIISGICFYLSDVVHFFVIRFSDGSAGNQLFS